ncbi:HMG (high mobility group) box domain-containing protein [Hirsutella rhossiliensis]|uniref:HMG (High mobility group) box domain-containing protein n=1 Tax=Hirsutella rhossiliensis TaxID=111463 RepID=A0A9P8MSY1_9HYPO|nr:HMG (high mobility group) box domain-containing protein [Hirsutella rhossiliensis]KAH0960660.1 HMG (high mobility group) box domain-containing protein [Hirsutella rhossiliensis]
MSRHQPYVDPGEIHQAIGSDYSRCHATLPAEGLPSYTPNPQELTPPTGYPRPDASACGVYSADPGQESYASYAYPPYTPEMSPLAMAGMDDAISTRNGLNISRRLRSADSHHVRPGGVEKRRKPAKSGTKQVSLKKHISLQRPLSEVMEQTGNVEVSDVFNHVHRPNDVRMDEASKEGKIKRPLNAFLLYRKHVIGYVKKELLGEENKNNQQLVSRICGDSWKMETDEVKSNFKKLAQAEKTRHGQAFPTYKYTPNTGKKRDTDDIRKPERSKSAGSGIRPATASSVGERFGTSSPHMAGTGQYNFGLRSEAAIMAQRGLYGEDAYGNMQPLATLYGQHYPGQQVLFAMPELGHGWSQELPPVGSCASEPHSQVELPMNAHLRGIPSSSANLYIDPSLLPGMGEAAHQLLPREDGLQGHHVWQTYRETADGMMAVMPDLDVNGAHNAYLRGGQEDWHVEPLDDTSHFSDWMAQEDNSAGT